MLSDGAALFEGADRESWCRANLPAYNRSEPSPAGFAPMPSHDLAERSVAGAPAPAYGSAGAARAPRSAPQPLMVPGPHRQARYVCSDAFFFCFARDRCRAPARPGREIGLPQVFFTSYCEGCGWRHQP